MPKTILLVDDNEDDVFLITRAFRTVELVTPLVHAGDGQQALDYFGGAKPYDDRIKFPVPSLVLLDVKMPFLSGFDVLSWLRAQSAFAHVPVVMFTTSNQECDVRRAYEAGANAYLVKPPHLESCTILARLIKQFWLEANVPPPSDLSPRAALNFQQQVTFRFPQAPRAHGKSDPA